MHQYLIHLHHIHNLQPYLLYLKKYGYVFLFLGTLLEGELVLLIAGFLAFLGALSLPLVILVGFFGAAVGDNIWFYLGQKGGRGFLYKYGKYFLMHESRIINAEKYFQNHGRKTVFFSRFVFGTRISSAILAGALGMKSKMFILANFFGAAIWAIITALLGYFFGRSFEALAAGLKRTELALLILVLAAIIILLLRNLATKAEQK